MTALALPADRRARWAPLIVVLASIGIILGLMTAALLIGRGLSNGIIAYTKITNDGSSQIYVYDLDRRIDQAVTHGRGMRIAPAWSADGEWMSYIGPYQDDSYAVFVRPFGTGDALPVVEVDQLNFNAAQTWSPDGRTLAVTMQLPSGYQGVYLVAINGSTPPRQLTPDRGSAFFPSWSPDGEWIAFSWSPVANSEIWRLPVTGETTLVTGEMPQPERLTFDFNADTAPRYSPDGAWIAFETGRDDNTEIYLLPANPVPLDGASPAEIETQAESNLINLTQSHWRETMPTWSPDGRRVAFLQFQRARTRLMVVDIARPGVLMPLIDDLSILYAPSWRPR